MQSTKVAIIGGGLTGLSLAFYLTKAGVECKILEKTSRIGGAIKSTTEQGFTFESGPNTGVLGNIEIENLIAELQEDCTLEIANESAKKRLIWKNGKWNALPSGLISAITTPLFSTFDKFKILGEPFRKKGTNPDENLRDLVERRLGNTFHNYAIAPFINGVYAGNTEKLITRFALPKLYALEQEYGSFIKGSIQKSKYNKRHNIKTASKKVFSNSGGLESLINALGKKLIGKIEINCSNLLIKKSDTNYKITWQINEQEHIEEFTHVIYTINAPEIITSCEFINEAHKEIFSKIEYASVIQASIGFKVWKGMNIEAFGGLIPPKENRNLLGILFPSSMFPNRAPIDGALLSVFMGGTLKPELFLETDDEIREIITKEVSELLEIKDFNPELLKISRYKYAITQYTIHYKKVLQAISEIEETHKNLIIAGSIHNGIGMADRVKQAYDIALKFSL